MIEQTWWIHKQGQILGPWPATTIREKIRTGELELNDLAQEVGQKSFAHLVEIEAVFEERRKASREPLPEAHVATQVLSLPQTQVDSSTQDSSTQIIPAPLAPAPISPPAEGTPARAPLPKFGPGHGVPGSHHPTRMEVAKKPSTTHYGWIWLLLFVIGVGAYVERLSLRAWWLGRLAPRTISTNGEAVAGKPQAEGSAGGALKSPAVNKAPNGATALNIAQARRLDSTGSSIIGPLKFLPEGLATCESTSKCVLFVTDDQGQSMEIAFFKDAFFKQFFGKHLSLYVEGHFQQGTFILRKVLE